MNMHTQTGFNFKKCIFLIYLFQVRNLWAVVFIFYVLCHYFILSLYNFSSFQSVDTIFWWTRTLIFYYSILVELGICLIDELSFTYLFSILNKTHITLYIGIWFFFKFQVNTVDFFIKEQISQFSRYDRFSYQALF